MFLQTLEFLAQKFSRYGDKHKLRWIIDSRTNIFVIVFMIKVKTLFFSDSNKTLIFII